MGGTGQLSSGIRNIGNDHSEDLQDEKKGEIIEWLRQVQRTIVSSGTEYKRIANNTSTNLTKKKNNLL